MWRCFSKSPRFARGRRSRSPSVSSAVKRCTSRRIRRRHARAAAGRRAQSRTVGEGARDSHLRARQGQDAGGGRRRLHVINALSDAEHPCQALADMLTLRRALGRLPGPHAGVRGRRQQRRDIARARCAAAGDLGSPGDAARLRASGARRRSGLRARARRGARQDVSTTHARRSWAPMPSTPMSGRRWARKSEAVDSAPVFQPFQVNGQLMAPARPRALFMHCLPAHRGEEVTADVFEVPASVVFDQAENRLHTQKALLLMLLS